MRQSITLLVRGLLAATAVTALLAAGPAFAQTPAVVGASSPGVAISSAHTTVAVPVTISRDATTALLGFSVQIQLSPEFAALNTAGDVAIGTFMTVKPGGGTAQTSLYVTPDPVVPGLYKVDGVVLGADCGPTAQTGTLFTVTLRSSAAAATGSLTVTSVLLRDCDNATVNSAIGTAASVVIDNTAPTVTVTFPNVIGDTLVYQTTRNITWTAGDVGGTVTGIDLQYSIDGGINWLPIATNEANDGTYAWAVPNNPTIGARVRLTAHDSNGNSATDDSDQNFVLLANTAPKLVRPLPNPTVNEGSLLTFTVSATDGESPPQALTYSFVLPPPVGMYIDPVTGVFTWTPTEDQGPGIYTIGVRVTDDGVGPLHDQQTVVITVNEVNTPPTVAPVEATIPELAPYTFTVSATDPDVPANPLTYSLTGAPASASIHPTTGVFTWTPSEAEGPADYSFTVHVNDGQVTVDAPVTLHVTEVDVAPVLTGVPASPVNIPESALYTFDANATDTDLPGQTLTFSLVGAPADASIDPVTGVFTWTPAETEGGSSHTFTVRVNDTYLDTDIPLTLNVDEVNVAPVITGAPSTVTIPETIPYSFTAIATDPDVPVNTQTFSLVGEPSGAAIGATTGIFTWTPSEAQGPGSYPFTVRVNDGTVDVDFPITITVSEGNTAPVLTGVPASPVNIPESAPYTFDANATDADLPPQTLTFSLAGAPTGANIDPGTGVFSWTPAEDQGSADYTFTVQVSDGVATTGTPLTLHVDEANVAPVLTGVPASPVTIPESALYTFDANATDSDDPTQTLTFSLSGAPAGAGIDPGTGVFSWTPAEDQGSADYTFTVQVSDGVATTGTLLTLHVNEANVAPVLTGVPTGTVTIPEMAPYSFDADATDSDLPTQALTFSLAGAPTGAGIDPGTGVFSWTPAEDQGNADYAFTVQVSDGVVITGVALTLHVNEVNRPPSIANVPPTVTIPELVAYTFTATATDPDLPANTLAFSLVGAPAGAAIGATTGIFTWTPTEEQGPGIYNFTVSVSDGAAQADAAISITVSEVSIAAITDLGASIVRSGNDGDGTTKIQLTWAATPEGTTVEVYRARYGFYPRYDEAGGVPPAPPVWSPMSMSPWELTSVTSPGQTDEVSNGESGYAGRDYWYYVAFVRGSGANVSGPSNQSARPNYLLGDVSDGTPDGLGRGNNIVNNADISALGSSYGLTGSALDVSPSVRYLDVGPTSDHTVNGRPLTDSAVDFEDLVLFAINFGTGTAPQLSATPRGGAAASKFSEDRLLVQVPAAVTAGEEFAVRLRLEGTGRVQALSAALDWDAERVVPIGVEAGEWTTRSEGVAFSPRPGCVDVSLLGARATGYEGEGEVAIVRFRALATGQPGVTLAASRARDVSNQSVPLTGGLLAAGIATPAMTMLAPAFPNPFRGSATVAFSLSRTGRVSVSVYGVDGRRVRVLADGTREAGSYRLEWDGRDDQGQSLPAGIYFVRMTSPEGNHTRRISYLR